MAIKTNTDVKSAVSNPEGGFIKSILEPGNYTVKINSIFLQQERDPKFGDRLILNLETKPIGGNFKGFAISKEDPSKGHHLGRVGNVGYSRYSFRDFVTDEGTQIVKEIELQVAIQELCRVLGLTQWYLDQNEKEHVDMTAFIKALDVDKPFKDVWFDVCIMGREYMSQGKYVNYEMYFPFANRNLGVPYSRDAAKVIKFFRSEHIIPLTNKPSDTTQSSTIKDSSKEHAHTEPAKVQHQSAQEIAFIEEGVREKEAKAKAERDQAFLDSMNEGNSEEIKTGIITTEDNTPLPWEV